MIKQLSILTLFTFIWPLQGQQSDFEHISFKNANRIAMSLKGEELNNLPLLAYKLTNNLKTDVERFRAIYIWVCHNIKNDYDLMQKNERKRLKFKNEPTKLNKWNSKFKKEVFDKLLKQKKTLCSGYAYLIKELALLAGIECEIINGYGKLSTSFKNIKTPNHSWNAVKLNNKWYLCDATWSSGFVDHTGWFKFKYTDAFFLMAPKKFAESHRPLDSKWLLLKNNIFK